MTDKERTMWEQAVQVLRRNSVTTAVKLPEAKQVLAEARGWTASQGRGA
jgi:hypothetical protein